MVAPKVLFCGYAAQPKVSLEKEAAVYIACVVNVLGLVRRWNPDILFARHWLRYTGDNGQL